MEKTQVELIREKPVHYLHYLQRHGKAHWFKLPTQETQYGKQAAAA